MNLFEKPYRYRFALIFIKLAVILHICVSSEDVKAILYYVFRVKVSHKTICEWSRKFPEKLPDRKLEYGLHETLILFSDEKFVWIKSQMAYWWTVRDHLGNILSAIVTTARDTNSAKELFRRAKQNINGKVFAVVHDGLASYDSAVHWSFGRKCQSIITGINGKFVMIGKELFWLTNNMSESINAQIDAYLAKHHYNFNSIESANRYAQMFMLRKNLRELCS